MKQESAERPVDAVRARMTRRALVAASAVAAALALPGCSVGGKGQAEAPVPAAGPPVELVFWAPTPPAEPGATLEKLLGESHALQPRLTVRVEPILAAGSDVTKAVAAIVAGTAPDLFYLGRWLTNEFASRKVISSLEGHLKRATKTVQVADYYSRLLTESRWRNELYGIPYVSDARALFFNRAHFRDAGLSVDRPPETWDQLDQAAARLAKPDGQPARLGYVPGWGNPPTNLAWLLYL